MVGSVAAGSSESLDVYMKALAGGSFGFDPPVCSTQITGFALAASPRFISGSTCTPGTFRGETVQELTVENQFMFESEGFYCLTTSQTTRLVIPTATGQDFFTRIRVILDFDSSVQFDALSAAATYSSGTWSWPEGPALFDYNEYVAGYTVILDY